MESLDENICNLTCNPIKFMCTTIYGNKYEYTAIMDWINKNRTDPMNGMFLDKKDIILGDRNIESFAQKRIGKYINKIDSRKLELLLQNTQSSEVDLKRKLFIYGIDDLVIYKGVDLRSLTFIGRSFRFKKIIQADFSGSEFIDCDMSYCMFAGSNFSNVKFIRCKFYGIHSILFYKTEMLNVQFIE